MGVCRCVHSGVYIIVLGKRLSNFYSSLYILYIMKVPERCKPKNACDCKTLYCVSMSGTCCISLFYLWVWLRYEGKIP